MKITFALLLFLVISLYSFSQVCAPPINAEWSDDGGSYFAWEEPETECDILYYEIQYAYFEFSPENNEGTLLTPLSGNFYNTDVPGPDAEAVAYIRTVCDCDLDLEPDGIGTEGAGWAPVAVNYCECEDPGHTISFEILNEGEIYTCGEEVPALGYALITNIPIFEQEALIYFEQNEVIIDDCTTLVENSLLLQVETCNAEFCLLEPVLFDYIEWEYTIISESLTPEITCPTTTYNYETEGSSFAMLDLTSDLIVQEGCSESSITQLPAPGELLAPGEHEIVFTITDECGNSNSCTSVVIVNQLISDYSLEVLENTTINCGDQLPEFFYELGQSWSENTVVTENVVTEPDGCTEAVTYTVTAADGDNSESAVTEVSIIDTTNPVWLTEMPETLTLSCGEDIPDYEIVTTDNCSSEITVTYQEADNEENCISGINRTWTATDDCGNQTSITQSVIFIDEQAPIFITCPEEMFLYPIGENGGYIMPDLSSEVEVSDNCSETPIVTQSITIDSEADFFIDETVTVSATDECGNSSSCNIPLTFVITGNIDELTPIEFTVYPNPSSELINFNIEGIIIENHSVRIRNVMGQEVLYLNEPNVQSPISIATLNSGIYFVGLIDDKGITVASEILKVQR